MDRSKKLKHNCGKVLQLISSFFFSSSPNSAPLVAISPLFQWAIFPAAVGAVISPCCLLSTGCAAFPLFVFKFLFQHLLTGFLSCSFPWMTLSLHVLYQEVDGLESGCGLNLPFSQHFPPVALPLYCGFSISRMEPVCFHAFCHPQKVHFLGGPCRVAEQECSGQCSSMTWVSAGASAGGLPVSPSPQAGHLLSRPGCLLCSKLF